jgi:hypothetical protein
MTPTDYEAAVLQFVRLLFPAPNFDVRPDIRLPGRKSRRRRQIDIVVFASGSPDPLFIFEAKRYSRPVNLTVAGSIIACVQDIGGTPTIVASTSGFSAGAKNHFEAEGIGYIKITVARAEGLRWILLLMQKFGMHPDFAEASGHLLQALGTGDARPFLETDVPYEEWLAVMACGEDQFPEETWRVLKALARQHDDDGVRFNSVSILIDAGMLSTPEAEELAHNQLDPDWLELLAPALR